ncbi:hypothetical protein EWU23_04185 [Cytophagaceae bacterium 50C-KIRBA]|uniref:DUF3052 domain-containing protein n=1 Tax=Aquirufa beregesia TaxID=2516556 RepID=A0ABX0EWB4_9BACT|nr:hypothetical protein [Aquirufa beregesia]NGZ43668.1 hypothetical protein [Aquirufa beregesia]
MMDPVLKKLAFKEQKEILVLQAPESFQQTLSHLPDGTILITSIDQVNQMNYAIVFVTQKIEIQQFAQACLDKIVGDAMIWMCYPKGSSKKYTCDFNRDKGWEPMGEIGFEPVSQIAIDEDWSALRFRNVHFIKSLKRNPDHIMSKEGKARMRN